MERFLPFLGSRSWGFLVSEKRRFVISNNLTILDGSVNFVNSQILWTSLSFKKNFINDHNKISYIYTYTSSSKTTSKNLIDSFSFLSFLLFLLLFVKFAQLAPISSMLNHKFCVSREKRERDVLLKCWGGGN